jgi:hypothetical protein
MTEPAAPPRLKPMTLALAASVAAFAAVIRVVPYDHRGVLNFVPLGAVALFAGARLGLGRAVLLALGVQLVTDLVLWVQHGTTQLYTPWFLAPVHGWTTETYQALAAGAAVYGCFALYALLGRRLLARTASPAAVGLTAAGAGLVFFGVTNFVSWLVQMVPYGYSLGGLLDCYTAAVPFYRGTFLGDVAFSVGLFAAHAALARAYFPAEKVVPAEVRA